MRFDVRDDIRAAPIELAPAVGRAAERGQRLAHRDSFVVGLVEPGGVEAARHRVAADQRRTEPHAFLVAERNDFDGKRQSLFSLVQVLDACDRAQDAEEPIVFARIADAVHVRTGHHDRGVAIGTVIAPDDIAERVEDRSHPRLPHQCDQPFAG